MNEVGRVPEDKTASTKGEGGRIGAATATTTDFDLAMATDKQPRPEALNVPECWTCNNRTSKCVWAYESVYDPCLR